MPLSANNIKRELIHKRKVECYGYRRDDNLWDIEGHLVDTKTYDFSNMDRGAVKAGEPVHEMWLRITVDDDLVIQNTEASTEYGPFNICPGAVPNFSKIKNVKIGSGFHTAINKLVGGSLGCTHLRELLGPMATTAFQTIIPIRSKRANGNAAKNHSLVGSCHAYARGSEVVKRLWPELETRDSETPTPRAEN